MKSRISILIVVFLSCCSGISSILFETRLGCLQEEIPTDTLQFISAVNDMLALSETVLFFPRWTRHIFPFWKRFVQAWDDLYDVGMLKFNVCIRDAQYIITILVISVFFIIEFIYLFIYIYYVSVCVI